MTITLTPAQIRELKHSPVDMLVDRIKVIGILRDEFLNLSLLQAKTVADFAFEIIHNYSANNPVPQRELTSTELRQIMAVVTTMANNFRQNL